LRRQFYNASGKTQLHEQPRFVTNHDRSVIVPMLLLYFALGCWPSLVFDSPQLLAGQFRVDFAHALLIKPGLHFM
jgi:hypothetical protein